MELKDGWFERQAKKAAEEIAGWSKTKQEVMLREPEPAKPLVHNCDGLF